MGRFSLSSWYSSHQGQWSQIFFDHFHMHLIRLKVSDIYLSQLIYPMGWQTILAHKIMRLKNLELQNIQPVNEWLLDKLGLSWDNFEVSCLIWLRKLVEDDVDIEISDICFTLKSEV